MKTKYVIYEVTRYSGLISCYFSKVKYDTRMQAVQALDNHIKSECSEYGYVIVKTYFKE